MKKVSSTSTDWWRSALIYQIYPLSFYSTHGGAIGDLDGITEKMDYLANLGIDIIWISPFFPSPMKDAGYDVSNYCDVDTRFGTLDNFDKLVKAAHKRDLKVMIDQVYNHTSNLHPWFAESSANRTNPRADWYVWANPKPDGTPPNNWLSVFGGPAWTWHSSRRQYYLHQFVKEQPDLNFNFPPVQDAILDVAAFWIERGVDGFRLDTVNRYVQHPDLPDNPPLSTVIEVEEDWQPVEPIHMQYERYNQAQPSNLDFLRRLRTLCDTSGVILLGEIGAVNQEELLGAYTSSGDALHTGYTFNLLRSAIHPQFVQQQLALIDNHLSDGWPCWAFSNHDVMRAISRHSGVPESQRDSYARLLLTLLLSLRGTPCLYQGEELALPESQLEYDELDDPVGLAMWPEIKGRDGCRTPLPWDSTKPYCGFSSQRPWLPIKKPQQERAVNLQEHDPHSTLNFFRVFIKWRKSQPALCGLGALTITQADDRLLVINRQGSPSIRAGYNFSAHHVSIAVAHSDKKMLDSPLCQARQEGQNYILPPYSSVFIECQ